MNSGSPAVRYERADLSLISPADDFSHLPYARGYLFSQSPAVEIPGHWKQMSLFGGTLSWDPRTDLAIAATDDAEVLLIGLAVHTGIRSASPEDIVAHLHRTLAESRSAYLDTLEDLAGSYAVFDRIGGTVRAQTDATGVRSLFHDSTASIVGSHASLVGTNAGTGESRWLSWVEQPGAFEFPGRTTEYEDVWLLIPNTEVTLRRGDISRVGPRPFEPRSVESALEEIVEHVDVQVDLLSTQERPLVVSLSGGVDSRTSLAALLRVKDDIEFFTYLYPGEIPDHRRSTTHDHVAVEIGEKYDLRHRVLNLESEPARPPRAFREALRISEKRSHGDDFAWLYHQHFPHDAIHIRSQVNGVGKWFFGMQLQHSASHHLDARTMAAKTKRGKALTKEGAPREAFDRGAEAFQEYIDTTELRSVPTGYQLSDMLLWEHRLPQWGRVKITDSDVTFETYQFFNSRRILQLLLSVPETDRIQLSLFREFVKHYDSALLNYPVNGKRWKPANHRIPLAYFQMGQMEFPNAARTRKKVKLEAERTLRKQNSDLKNQLAEARERYEALRSSKLGKIQTAYWERRKRK